MFQTTNQIIYLPCENGNSGNDPVHYFPPFPALSTEDSTGFNHTPKWLLTKGCQQSIGLESQAGNLDNRCGCK